MTDDVMRCIQLTAKAQVSRLPGNLVEAGDLENESVLAALRGRKSIKGPMQDFLRNQSIVGTYRASNREHSVRCSMHENIPASSHEAASIARVTVQHLLSKLCANQRRSLILYFWFGVTDNRKRRNNGMVRLRQIISRRSQ